MSQFVRVAGRNEQSNPAVFQPFHIDRNPRRHHDFSNDLRLGHDNPDLDLREIARSRWAIEQ